jgi:hypothetical protein
MWNARRRCRQVGPYGAKAKLNPIPTLKQGQNPTIKRCLFNAQLSQDNQFRSGKDAASIMDEHAASYCLYSAHTYLNRSRSVSRVTRLRPLWS